MRSVLLVGISLTLVASLSGQGGGSPSATYIGGDKVQGAITKGGAALFAIPDGSGSVAAGHRDKAGQVELHETVTEIYYVIDGEATFVTGGTMLDAKPTRPGNQSGSSISGGETFHLKKGDGMVIPPMTPHWFKEVPSGISYYVVNVTKK